MQIVVCAKLIRDPDRPPAARDIDPHNWTVRSQGGPPVISPLDENALELALRFKDQLGARITVVSLGEKLAKRVLERALAAGADELVLVQDPLFAAADGFGVATALAAAIRQLGAVDLVLTGAQAGDSDGGVVGLALAGALGINGLTAAQSVALDDDKAVIGRAMTGGVSLYEVTLPCLLTIRNEQLKLRYITIHGMRAAASKPVRCWNADELGLSRAVLQRTELRRLMAREVQGHCEFLTGDTPQVLAEQLLGKLRQCGAI